MSISVARRNFMRKLAQVILKMDDLDRFLNSLTEMAAEVFEVKWVTLSLLDEASGQYTLKASSPKGEVIGQDRKIANRDSAVSWLRDRQKILSRRLLDEFGSQMAPELRDELNKTDTFVSMPLFVSKRLIGVLNLGAKDSNEHFTKEDLNLLSELEELIAATVNQAVYHHKIAEQRLHHQNILDNLVSGIIAIDPEEKITVFNRAAEKILKFKSEEVLDKDVRILQANLANLLLDTLHKGKPYHREELYVLPENTLIGVSTSQFYDAKGELLGACMVFSNLVEIKKKQRLERRKNLDIYWSNLANSLAHEVKNSIVATKIFTEMFPEKYEDAEFKGNLYSTLKRDMEKLDKFSDKILNFAQSQELIIQSCQIDELIDAAINSALQDKDFGEITFKKKYTENLKPLPGDYHQLKEAFTEVISNALEAMGGKGKLSISITQENNPKMLTHNLPEAIEELPAAEAIVVKITNTGCGILPKDLPYLFDPFFTTKEARSGLGLASARKIIERHRGIIRAESKPGEGSTFWICLPVIVKVNKKVQKTGFLE